MKKFIRNILLKIVPQRIADSLLYSFSSEAVFAKLMICLRMRQEFKYARLSYSQEGEDLLIDRLLAGVQNGFYVDIGAHHPFRFSNTCLFYLKGWRGINVEPNPALFEELNKERAEDINLCLGVSAHEQQLEYYSFDEPALNTFSQARAKALESKGNRILKKSVVQTKPLSAILNENLPPNKTIDFMSIDTEGLDLEVLKSNDWDKYRPKLIVVEDFERRDSLLENTNSSLHDFLTSKEYTAFSIFNNSVIYKAYNYDK